MHIPVTQHLSNLHILIVHNCYTSVLQPGGRIMILGVCIGLKIRESIVNICYIIFVRLQSKLSAITVAEHLHGDNHQPNY